MTSDNLKRPAHFIVYYHRGENNNGKCCPTIQLFAHYSTFSMNFDETPVAAFMNIKNFEELTDLTLQGFRGDNWLPYNEM